VLMLLCLESLLFPLSPPELSNYPLDRRQMLPLFIGNLFCCQVLPQFKYLIQPFQISGHGCNYPSAKRVEIFNWSPSPYSGHQGFFLRKIAKSFLSMLLLLVLSRSVLFSKPSPNESFQVCMRLVFLFPERTSP